MIKERWYILDDDGKFLFYWNFCVIWAAIYQGVYIPL